MRIGLCGSHRTGKTTLASIMTSKLDVVFLQTAVSKVFSDHNLDPAKPLPFNKRLWIQNIILDTTEKVWEQNEGRSFITDRTPIDILAYTLADIKSDCDIDYKALEEYINRCFDITNKAFSSLFIVQPGIALEYAPGKAVLNVPYIELLNTIILGIVNDERLRVKYSIISRDTLSIDDRVRHIYYSTIINNAI